MRRRTGYTTKMLIKALSFIETAYEFPVVIISVSTRNARRLKNKFIKEATNCGFTITCTTCDMVELNGGSWFLFCSEHTYLGYRLRGSLYSEILVDNDLDNTPLFYENKDTALGKGSIDA